MLLLESYSPAIQVANTISNQQANHRQAQSKIYLVLWQLKSTLILL
jgi:hypothetical protein